MSAEPQLLTFTLQTDPGHFSDRLDDMLQEMTGKLPEGVPVLPVMKKCKWILTELITNGYKHSGQPRMSLHMHFHPEHLHIVKEDTGNPLSINLPGGECMGWPLDANYLNREINIFSDHLNILNALVDDTGRTTFLVKQKTAEHENDMQSMNEHFGLIIIANACEEFNYYFEKESGKNIFTSVIRY